MSVEVRSAGTAVVTAPRSDRSSAVYGIRALAALALLTVHVAMFSGLLGTRALGTPRPPSNFFGAFLVSGLPAFIGVFFVLPATYLYMPLAKAVIAGTKRPAQMPNLLRRLLRLLPGYYVMYLIVLLTLNRHHITGIWSVLRPILLLQVYLPSPFVPKLMNGMEVTWTVPSMVQWYMVLPLIGWAIHRFAARGATPAIRARRLMLPVPFLIAIGVGWLFFVKARGWDNRIVFWWPQGFAPAIGIGMALAILLALSQVSPPDTPRVFRAAAAHPNHFWLGALAVYIVNCARPFSVIGMDAIYSTSGLLMTYIMLALFGLFSVLPLVAPGAKPNPIGTALASRPLAYLGKISYGVYLWHFAMMHFILQPDSIFGGDAKPIRELYGTSGFWALEILTLAGSVAAASLSYRLIEVPIAAWGDRLLQRPRGAPPASPRLPRWLETLEPGATATTREQAAAAVAAATMEHDAVQSNLIDLERSFGRQLLADATLTGRTKQRWEAAAADLNALWEIFNAYSAVMDEAARTLSAARHPSASDLATITAALTGASVTITRTPAPLDRRHITDNGCTRLTPAEAVAQMDLLFGSTAELVSAVETVWREVTGKLDAISGDLIRARGQIERDGACVTALASAEAEANRHRQTLDTDPLAMWRPDRRVEMTDLDRLRRNIAAAVAGDQS